MLERDQIVVSGSYDKQKNARDKFGCIIADRQIMHDKVYITECLVQISYLNNKVKGCMQENK